MSEKDYDKAFECLGAAISAQDREKTDEAIQRYLEASLAFRQLTQLEPDIEKQSLLNNEIIKFENRLIKLIKAGLSDKYKMRAADTFVELATLQDEHRMPGRSEKEEVDAIAEVYCLAAELYIAIGAKNAGPIMDHVAYLKGIPTDHEQSLAKSTTNSGGGGTNNMATLFGHEKRDAVTQSAGLLSLPSPPSTLLPSISSLPAPPAAPALTPTPAHAAGNGMALHKSEIEVLRGSSVVDGVVYLPWVPGEEMKERFRFDSVWSDPMGLLEMSVEQIQAGAVFRRPKEYVPIFKTHTPNTIAVLKNVDPYCITQRLVSDCSFVCSLAITAAFEKRFNRRLITKIIYPQSPQGEPVFNPSGKYLVKLHFNGIERKVVIDDRLPTHKHTGDLLCSHSICNEPHELWVSLIEKAYMKLHGGYNFPGSNSGIDLYCLTGWIPEHFRFLKDAPVEAKVSHGSDRQSEDRAWKRLSSAHAFGDCLITISTPHTLSKADQEATGLVDGHAYAVLDVVEAGSLRMLRVKNPWASRPWIGRFSSRDQKAWTHGLRKKLGVRTDEEGGRNDFEMMEKAGVFWIEFRDCRKYFDAFILNWNPDLFEFRLKFHAHWPVSQGPRKDKFFVGENPQYSLLVDRPRAHHFKRQSAPQSNEKAKRSPWSGKCGEEDQETTVSVWLLLTRHVTTTAVSEHDDSEGPDDSNSFALHVYRGTNGKRVYCPLEPKAYIRGVYTQEPHILVRFDVEFNAMMSVNDANELSTESVSHTLVVSQLDKTEAQSYTLEVLSTGPFRLKEAPPTPPHTLTLNGAWTDETSGGRVSSSNFYKNPQYGLCLNEPEGRSKTSQVLIEAWFPATVSAIIILARNSRSKVGAASMISHLSDDDVVMEAHAYTKGYSYVELATVPNGDYTLILSTWSSEMRGSFRIKVSCTHAHFSANALRAEGTGMLRRVLPGQWAGPTEAGCANHGRYLNNPRYFFNVIAPARVEARLQVDAASVRGRGFPSLNISLYRVNASIFSGSNDLSALIPSDGEASAGFHPAKAVATSHGGAYMSTPSGVAIALTPVLPKGTYVLIPSTFDPAALSYSLSIYATEQSVLNSIKLVV